MKREQDQRWSALSRAALDPLKTDDRPGDTPAQIVDWFGELSDAGAQHIIFNVRDVWDPAIIETLGRDVIPGLHALG